MVEKETLISWYKINLQIINKLVKQNKEIRSKIERMYNDETSENNDN